MFFYRKQSGYFFNGCICEGIWCILHIYRQNIIELPSGMCPTVSIGHTIYMIISIITISDDSTTKSFQKFLRIGCFSVRSVIKYLNRSFAVFDTWIYPHIRLRSNLLTWFIQYLNWRFITMYVWFLHHQFVHPVHQWNEIFLGGNDDPVSHGCSWQFHS